jgi:type II secretory pathway pseudopilin PulG
MKKPREQTGMQSYCNQEIPENRGFALAEFLISVVIVLSLSAGVFSMLADVQTKSGYQTEVLGVMENTRVAMRAIERYVVQAGNNPSGASLTPVTIGDNQVQLCTDLTGLSGGNQGDPDGDILDENKDITIRYNSTGKSIELVTGDGSVRTLANYISGFSLQYFDVNGNPTTDGAAVRSIGVQITGASTKANPQTRKTFGLVLTNRFNLPNQG